MQLRSRIPAAGLALCLIMSISGIASGATVTFQDGIFANASWTIVAQILNGGGSANGFQVLTGGNPAEYRRIDNTLNSAIGTGVSNSVFGFHRFSGGVYDPAVGGPILALSYSEDSLRIAGGIQATGPALRQAGVIYYGPTYLTPTAFGVWVTTTASGLTASQFDALAPGVQNPDFSVAGGPIEFGFFRANSTSVGGGGGTTSNAIDNWSIVLTTDAAVSTETTTWGDVKAQFRGDGASR